LIQALQSPHLEDAFLRFQSFKDEAHSELWLKGQKGRVTGNWIQYNEAPLLVVRIPTLQDPLLLLQVYITFLFFLNLRNNLVLGNCSLSRLSKGILLWVLRDKTPA
jgi:hypothetical protein